MRAVRVGRILAQLLKEKPGGEDVNAHRSERVLWVAGDRLRVGRFFLKALDAAFGVDLHHAEFGRFGPRHPQGTDSQVGAMFFVMVDQAAVVHFVNVIAGQDHDIFGALFFQGVDILIDGVGGALVPVFVDPLLGRGRCRRIRRVLARAIRASQD